jgi:hypothetical protein
MVGSEEGRNAGKMVKFAAFSQSEGPIVRRLTATRDEPALLGVYGDFISLNGIGG